MSDVARLHPKDFSSDLDEIAREGARRMLAQALEAEVVDCIARNQEKDDNGHAQVVRNGKARPRKVTLGSGTIEVQAPRAVAAVPRLRDRKRFVRGLRSRFGELVFGISFSPREVTASPSKPDDARNQPSQ